jgi:protein TonB
MGDRRDILDQPDSLRSPFFGSLVVHGIVLSLIAFYSLAGAGHHETWGSPMALGGGAVGITAVKTIPLPAQTGAANPVANDTQSHVPLPPKKAQKAAPKAVENAVPIKARNAPKRQAERAASTQQFRPDKWQQSNQLYSTAGQALSSPRFGGMSGSGAIGFGSAAFGNRFGYYSDILQRRVAEKWNTGGLAQNSAPVIVGFDILRSGQTKNIRVLQSSGNRGLDDSALRAVYEASPFNPLPAGYSGSQVDVELWFYVKR